MSPSGSAALRRAVLAVGPGQGGERRGRGQPQRRGAGDVRRRTSRISDDNDALPDTPLVAMVPVSLRTDRDSVGGNMVGAVLCNLATHLDDPADRLNAIHASMRGNKNVLSQLPRAQALAVSLLLLSPAALNTLPGLAKATPPPFNVCISNVPGAREPLYFNGARMVGNYPMSLVLDGQALNITLTSTADSLDFGVVGCRRSVPHVQRVLSHLETSLKELERAVGL